MLAANSILYLHDTFTKWWHAHPEPAPREWHDSHGRVQSTTSTPAASDATVASAQSALNSQGYNAGSADGRMGPTTRAAVTKFQVDHNLQQTGTLDDATLNALNVGH